jgi:hypothetical protein
MHGFWRVCCALHSVGHGQQVQGYQGICLGATDESDTECTRCVILLALAGFLRPRLRGHPSCTESRAGRRRCDLDTEVRHEKSIVQGDFGLDYSQKIHFSWHVLASAMYQPID